MAWVNDAFLEIHATHDEVIEHLRECVMTELRCSPIHGIGTFAIRNITQGERVFVPWKHYSAVYAIPEDRIREIPESVLQQIDKYFISNVEGYRLIKLFNNINFLCNGLSYCNSAHPHQERQNIDDKGIALRDIQQDEELLLWYTSNI
jgi:hypothetical protein